MTVSRSDVVWCYRKVLGRDPESEAVIDSHARLASLKELVECFVDSREFKQRTSNAGPTAQQGQVSLFHRLDLEPNAVEVSASAAQIAACIDRIRAAWSHLGEKRPHFSVLTSPEFLPQNIDKGIDEFWRTGEQEAEQVRRILAKYEFGDLSQKTCVEYGCGVGRVTIGLARLFKRMHGYDISAKHLDLAKARCEAAGVRNVAFHECSRNVLQELEKCDFYYSRIVLQHNPPPLIVKLIRNALRSLKPTGIAMFQVPTYRMGYRFTLDEWLKAEYALEMQMHCLPQEHIFSAIAAERCVPLGVREDNSTGRPDRFISNVFVVRKPKTSRIVDLMTGRLA